MENTLSEKRELRSDLWKTGTVALIFALTALVVSFAGAFAEGFKYLSLYGWSVAFVITFLIIIRKDFTVIFKTRFSTERNKSTKIFSGVCRYMTAVAGGILLVGIIVLLLEAVGVNPLGNLRVIPVTHGFGKVVYVIYSCILAPVIYELVFRGYILGKLSVYDKKGAVYVSALLYSLVYGTYITIPIVFMTGVVLGNVALSSRSLMTPIKVNIFSTLLLYAAMGAVSGEYKILTIIFFVVLGFLALIGLVAFINSFKGKVPDIKNAIISSGKFIMTLPGFIALLLIITEDIVFLIFQIR